MRNLRKILLVALFGILSGQAMAACSFKNTSNHLIFETTAMSVITGSTEIEYQCDANVPYKLFPYTDSIKIFDNNENLEVTYWLDPSFTERLTRGSPIFGIGNGKYEKKKIYVKITGKGPALNSNGNIVVNKHDLNIKHNLVIE